MLSYDESKICEKNVWSKTILYVIHKTSVYGDKTKKRSFNSAIKKFLEAAISYTQSICCQVHFVDDV